MAEAVAKPITTADWCAELEELATRASLMDRNKDVSLADRLELATAAFSRLWLAWSPKMIARSCRASAALLDPVLIQPGELDQQVAAVRAVRLEALAKVGMLERPATIAPVMPGPDAEAPEPEPKPRRPASPPTPPPPGWWIAEEVANLVGRDSATISRWRREGQMGAEGSGWQRCGRSYYYAPEVVEQLEQQQIPAGLDQLVADVQAP